jgi:hypothetical protein
VFLSNFYKIFRNLVLHQSGTGLEATAWVRKLFRRVKEKMSWESRPRSCKIRHSESKS